MSEDDRREDERREGRGEKLVHAEKCQKKNDSKRERI
jgi:hypothetical protein